MCFPIDQHLSLHALLLDKGVDLQQEGKVIALDYFFHVEEAARWCLFHHKCAQEGYQGHDLVERKGL
jgi:hypothetical protein